MLKKLCLRGVFVVCVCVYIRYVSAVQGTPMVT